MKYFFDTSALAKIYHQEDESETVIAIFNSDDDIFISELSVIEYYSIVYRKFREKRINRIDLGKIINRFEIDISKRFDMLIFSPSVMINAKKAFDVLGQEVFARTLDILQISFFKSNMDISDIFLTFDSRQSSEFEDLKKKDFFSAD